MSTLLRFFHYKIDKSIKGLDIILVAMVEEAYARARGEMVAGQLRARGIRDERVIEAMERAPRHEFVDEALRAEAYEDHPVAIGFGQTISQPFIVAYMLQLLSVEPGDTVLEVGAGTGYEAALLGELAARVYTVERHAGLALAARENLARLGYGNVLVVEGDGTLGVPEFAPYDRIVVAAAAPKIPEPLFAQLREGGQMVIPVGAPDLQKLQVVRKVGGEMVVSTGEGCRFVPLVGREGYGE